MLKEIVFVLVMFHFSAATRNITSNDEWRLTRELLRRYTDRQNLLPVTNASEAVNVTLSMRLVQIIELKEKIQMFSTSVWVEQQGYIIKSQHLDHSVLFVAQNYDDNRGFKIDDSDGSENVWYDPLLTWSTAEYNVTEINIPPSDIWVPDIVLGNNVNQDYMGRSIGLSEPVVVSSSGRVRWLTPTILDSFCKQFVRYFPFDDQYCPMKFYSLNYDEKNVRLKSNKEGILLNYTESGTWNIIDIHLIGHTTMKHHTMKSSVSFVVHIRRKTFHYIVYLIAPCMLIAIMATLVFYLPAASGERMVVGCTILLALSVFFLLATNYIPETSEAVPLVGRYYSLVIVEICVALVCTAWVLRYHYPNPALGKIPKWIRVYVFGYVSKMVRIKVPEEMLVKNTSSDQDTEEGRKEALAGGDKRCTGDDEFRGLALMAAQMTEDQKLGKIQEEWQLAAEIMNQFFMIVYILTAVLTFVVTFMNAPGVTSSHPVPSMEELIRVY